MPSFYISLFLFRKKSHFNYKERRYVICSFLTVIGGIEYKSLAADCMPSFFILYSKSIMNELIIPHRLLITVFLILVLAVIWILNPHRFKWLRIMRRNTQDEQNEREKNLSTSQLKCINRFSWWAFVFPWIYLLRARCYQSFLPLFILSYIPIVGLFVRFYISLNIVKRAYINSERDLEWFLKVKGKFVQDLIWRLFLVVLFFIISSIVNNNPY